jgi:hypothetical protein
MFLDKVLVVAVIFLFPLVGGLNWGLAAKHLVKYVIAILPTPVLHTPDFLDVFGGKNGSTLRLDEDNRIKELEFIALPKTVFKIEKNIRKDGRIIYKVTTKDYPYPTNKGYFIDSRFVKILKIKPPERPKILPSKQTIIQNLLSAKGSNYLWGGNYKDGVPQILSFYKPSSSVSLEVRDKWMLKGLDCSGLLYQATNGYTPRNTSSLVGYGAPVRITDLKVDQIIQNVEPLDIIVWKEHIVVILSKEYVIESRIDYDKYKKGPQGGVRIRRLKEVLVEIMERRVPVDSYKDKVEDGKKKFVIRRWYPILNYQFIETELWDSFKSG